MDKERPSRRAIIASRIYAPEPAAASFRLEAVQRALLDDGWEVEVLTTDPGLHRNGELEPHSPSLQIKRWPVLRDRSGYVRGYLPYMSFDIPLFFRLLASKKADVILVEPPPTTGVVARVAAAIRRTPYVWYAPDIWSDAVSGAGMSPVVTKVLTTLEKFAIKGARGIVTVSEGFAAKVATLGGKNILVAQGGIDTDVYIPSLTDERRKFDFLYSGTASEWQGATIFAEAFEDVLETFPEATLVFVGQGTDWPELEKAAEQVNTRHGREAITVLPPVSPQEVAVMNQKARCALVSIVPHTYDEVPYPYPTKVLAAVSSGIPVVYAGEGPAVDDIRNNELGITVPYEAKAVAQAMLSILGGSMREQFTPTALHAWAESKRSLKSMGREVSYFLETTAKTGPAAR